MLIKAEPGKSYQRMLGVQRSDSLSFRESRGEGHHTADERAELRVSRRQPQALRVWGLSEPRDHMTRQSENPEIRKTNRTKVRWPQLHIRFRRSRLSQKTSVLRHLTTWQDF